LVWIGFYKQTKKFELMKSTWIGFNSFSKMELNQTNRFGSVRLG